MTRDITLYIKDIIENMDKAEEFIENIPYEEFLNDEKTTYAVVRCIEIIGEAAKHIPYEIKRKHREILWKKMAGMRDKIAHVYFDINLEKVWLVIKKDIPLLKPQIKKVLEDLEGVQSQ